MSSWATLATNAAERKRKGLPPVSDFNGPSGRHPNWNSKLPYHIPTKTRRANTRPPTLARILGIPERPKRSNKSNANKPDSKPKPYTENPLFVARAGPQPNYAPKPRNNSKTRKAKAAVYTALFTSKAQTKAKRNAAYANRAKAIADKAAMRAASRAVPNSRSYNEILKASKGPKPDKPVSVAEFNKTLGRINE